MQERERERKKDPWRQFPLLSFFLHSPFFGCCQRLEPGAGGKKSFFLWKTEPKILPYSFLGEEEAKYKSCFPQFSSLTFLFFPSPPASPSSFPLFYCCLNNREEEKLLSKAEKCYCWKLSISTLIVKNIFIFFVSPKKCLFFGAEKNPSKRRQQQPLRRCSIRRTRRWTDHQRRRLVFGIYVMFLLLRVENGFSAAVDTHSFASFFLETPL